MKLLPNPLERPAKISPPFSSGFTSFCSYLRTPENPGYRKEVSNFFETRGAFHSSGRTPVELTKEKWNDTFHQKSISNLTEAFHLRFDRNFRLHHSEMGLGTRIFVNGTELFGMTGPSGQRGPPPEVVSSIPVGPNRNGPYYINTEIVASNFAV